MARKSARRKRTQQGAEAQVNGSSLSPVHPHAAGIDIGSESHYVSVPPDRASAPVQEFGCCTPELERMAAWLRGCGVETVAMESTGVYWVPVYRVLESRGLEVRLVDARQAKNVPGRKTDVQDCQWLRELHTFGLLRGCFIPPASIQAVRTYWRHRTELVEACARQLMLIQKALEQMNVQLHKAVTDIGGETGMRILRAIVRGERDPQVLASLRDGRVKKSESELAAALTGHYSEEHVFLVAQCLQTYDFLQEQMRECDRRLESCLSSFADGEGGAGGRGEEPSGAGGVVGKRCRSSAKRRKNQVHFDLSRELARINGVDLTQIDGISALTAQTIFSEVGSDLRAFATEKHFASWLALCPNNRKTGGRVYRTKTRRSANRVATALRLAAQSLHHSASALGALYRRLRARLGAPKAVTATAHRIAKLVYRMLRYGAAYVDEGETAYHARLAAQERSRLRRRAKALGLALIDRATGDILP